jgi:hypothetical protein
MKSWQPVNSTRAQNDKRIEGGNRDKESGNVHRRDDLILLRWPSEFNWQRRTKKITFTELWAQEKARLALNPRRFQITTTPPLVLRAITTPAKRPFPKRRQHDIQNIN